MPEKKLKIYFEKFVVNVPIISSKDINGIPVCHNSVLTAPAWKSANVG